MRPQRSGLCTRQGDATRCTGDSADGQHWGQDSLLRMVGAFSFDGAVERPSASRRTSISLPTRWVPVAKPVQKRGCRMLILALTAAAAVVLEAADARGASEAASDVPTLATSPKGSVYLLQPWTDGVLLGATTISWVVLATAGPAWVTPHCPCNASDVPSFDQVALHWHSQAAEVASNVTEVLALLAPVAVDLVDVGLGQAFFEDMVVYGEVLSISGTATEAAKYGVQRPRPYVYGSTSAAVLQSSASYASFFSGHATVTFGALTTLAMTETFRHGPRVWPWLLMALVGTSVAVERVLAGQHFPSDVVVGAAVGVGTGVLMPLFHRRETVAEPQVKLSFRAGGAGLEVSGRW